MSEGYLPQEGREPEPKPTVTFSDTTLREVQGLLKDTLTKYEGVAFAVSPKLDVVVSAVGHDSLAIGHGLDKDHALLHGAVIIHNGKLEITFYPDGLRRTLLSSHSPERKQAEEKVRKALTQALEME